MSSAPPLQSARIRLRTRLDRDQNPNGQGDQFDVAGCERIFIGHVSGKLASRLSWTKALLVAEREGDTLVVTKGPPTGAAGPTCSGSEPAARRCFAKRDLALLEGRR
jgi:hypothetical protein